MHSGIALKHVNIADVFLSGRARHHQTFPKLLASLPLIASLLVRYIGFKVPRTMKIARDFHPYTETS